MLLEKIKSVLSTSLSVVPPVDVKNRIASVLIVIYGNEPNVLMTKKSHILKIHAGEIAFPGGKYDPEDNSLKDTVIREIFEETGINLQEDNFLGVLDAVESKPKRNIKILPFIAFLKKRPVIKLNENELDKYFWIPYRKIVSNLGVANLNNRRVLAYFLEEEIVWGVTYRILGKFNEIINSLTTKH